jgi:hypothetical protein
MRFDRALSVGAVGGHGPIRYVIEAYEPSRRICFRFTAPRGFDGTHAFEVREAGGRVRLEHVLLMQTTGPARLTWPLVFRPLHDALLEDALDRAERTLTGAVRTPARWSPYVRALRTALRAGMGRRRSTDGGDGSRARA